MKTVGVILSTIPLSEPEPETALTTHRPIFLHFVDNVRDLPESFGL